MSHLWWERLLRPETFGIFWWRPKNCGFLWRSEEGDQIVAFSGGRGDVEGEWWWLVDGEWRL